MKSSEQIQSSKNMEDEEEYVFNYTTDEVFTQLVEQLKNNSFEGIKVSITTLDYDGNLLENAMKFGNKQLALLTELLAINPQITALDLSDNDISDIGDLSLIPHIKELALSRNPISNDSIISLFKTNSLITLDLRDIFFEETEELSKAIINNNSIKKLLLNNWKLNEEFIAKIINDNITIEILDLFNSDLKDKDLFTLPNNHTLKELNIARNNLTDKAIEYIINNTSLKELDISHNEITDAGAKVLAQHHSLYSLQVGANELTSQSFPYFINSKLHEISIDGGDFTINEIRNFYKEFDQARLSGENIEMTED